MVYQVYEVVEGDTVDSIADKVGISSFDLIRINGKSSFDVGDLIVVPNNGLYFSYFVKSGESLYDIARRFNQSVDVLYQVNGIKEGDYIYPNQEILIPNDGVSFYVTVDGDTLSTISLNSDVSVSDIASSNSELLLIPGQLVIFKND